VGLANTEGFEQALERGALQPQGQGGRRMLALGLGPRLAQQRALAGYRGGMIRQGGRGERREERRGSHEGRRELLGIFTYDMRLLYREGQKTSDRRDSGGYIIYPSHAFFATLELSYNYTIRQHWST
jgi:hypothetical protein